MSGYCYGEPEPIATCPWCGNDVCQAQYVDIGVGMQQCTPLICERCHAVQIGPFDEKPVAAEESEKGWYYPDPERWPISEAGT